MTGDPTARRLILKPRWPPFDGARLRIAKIHRSSSGFTQRFGRLAISQAVALIVPNALTAPAFVHAKGFAPARVKHYLNDVGPITAANALELFLSLFAG